MRAGLDDGNGPALYAGGSFTAVGGVAANHIAKWNGTSWSPLGSGIAGGSSVSALTVFDDGSGAGPALYAGGFFTTAGGGAANQVAKWNGMGWSPLGSGVGGVGPGVRALTVFDDGAGPVLFAGGSFTTAGGQAATRVAKWDGSRWSPLQGGTNHHVLALTVHDGAGGGGPELYAGGLFSSAGGAAVSHIAKWDGLGWSNLGSGLNSGVLALTVFDDESGGGPALYAGGFLTAAGGVPMNRIGRWDGSSWSSLGSGMTTGPTTPRVEALSVFDDGSGPALYAGGTFTSAGGVAANYVARWDGASWSRLGTGMKVGGTSGASVRALAVFDDQGGSGPALFVGGIFSTLELPGANNIAKWDGAGWSFPGSGMNGGVEALIVFDDQSGNGSALYAGGAFTTAGGLASNRIASWDGVSWSPAGSGMNNSVGDLTVFDDGSGSGPDLYAGGAFTTAGGAAANRIARWDGASWSPLGSGMNDACRALAVFDDASGSGPALLAGGTFSKASDSGDSYLARFGGCPDTEAPTLSCPASILVLDRLSGPPGELVTFSVTATDDFLPPPSVVCVPPSGSHFPRGTTLVTCTATDAAGNQSTCAFPVTVQLKARRR